LPDGVPERKKRVSGFPFLQGV
jgi:hypothetical protein